MPRVSKDEIDAKVIRLNRMGIPIVMEYAGEPQRPRAFLKPTEEEWLSHLSPRLTKGQMYEWLDAFERGFDEGVKWAKGQIEKVIKETVA